MFIKIRKKGVKETDQSQNPVQVLVPGVVVEVENINTKKLCHIRRKKK